MDKTAFQHFEDQSDSATVAPRIAALRAELAKRALDGFLVPHGDEYQGEYLPACAERLAFLTAFTGSAGAAIVLKDKAAVFVDGRYTLQVRQQTDTSLFEPRDLVAEGLGSYIETQVPAGATLGYDAWLHSQSELERLKAAAAKANVTLVAVEGNPLDAIWHDRPAPPKAKAQPHAFNLAGETTQSKRTRIAEEMKAKSVDAAVLTLGDSIGWLFNIRGGDVPHTPFALSYAIQYADGSADLFLDEDKRTAELEAHLGNTVRLRAPAEFPAALDTLGQKTVLADPASSAAAIFAQLESSGAIVKRGPDPCQLPKACKNPVEIEGARKAHIRDGAALTRFLSFMAREAHKGELTEIDAAKILEGYRRAAGSLTDLSFDSISAAGEHAALPHYRVTRSSNRRINAGDIYLIDSGGQYPDGTTDVTRTMIVGAPSAEMKDRFTRVLKGHIALSTVRFPEGTTGAQLDSLARRPLWDAGCDYDHGTGHGVGSYLSVHEGPQSISKKPIAQPLLAGMICSNEPGFYKQGAYGIRIENLIVVGAPEDIGGDRKVMEFEPLTLAPIDRNLIDVSLLNVDERAWIDAYHARVRDTLSPLLDDETRGWLNEVSQPL